MSTSETLSGSLFSNAAFLVGESLKLFLGADKTKGEEYLSNIVKNKIFECIYTMIN